MSGSLTLSDGDTSVNLIVTKISYSLVPATDRVFGWQSSYTTVQTVSTSTVKVTYLEPDLDSMATAIATLQLWAKRNTVLSLQGEEVDIVNWAGMVKDASYEWRYDQPMPAGQLEIETSVDWVFDSESPIISPVNLQDLYGTSNIVTKTISDIEKQANAQQAEASKKASQNANQQKMKQQPQTPIHHPDPIAPQNGQSGLKGIPHQLQSIRSGKLIVDRTPDGELNLYYNGHEFKNLTVTKENYQNIFGV